MCKIRQFSLRSGLELMTTRMMDDVLTNWTTEAGFHFSPIWNDVGIVSGTSEISLKQATACKPGQEYTFQGGNLPFLGVLTSPKRSLIRSTNYIL